MNKIHLLLSVIIFVMVVAVVFLFVVFNNRKNKILNEQLKKQLRHQKELYEMQLKSLRAQLNPHFIYNSLNAIQYYIQNNEVELSENYLSKFSKLMRMFFENSRKNNVTLENEIKLLSLYLEMEKMRFETKLNFQISSHTQTSHEDIILPSMILQPIIENAINHGIFHKPTSGKVLIEFTEIDHGLKVLVRDNGIGYLKALKLNPNNRTSSTSVLKDRIHTLKASKQWNVDYQITDRSTVTKDTGTDVLLIFTNLNYYDSHLTYRR